MSKRIIIIGSVCFAFHVASVSASEVPLSINPENCKELIEVADAQAVAVRMAGRKMTEVITNGTDNLAESSCLGKLSGLDFNFFEGIPSLRGMSINGARKAAKKAIGDLVDQGCQAGRDGIAKAKKATSCSAAVGVNINTSLSASPDIDVEECFGLDGGGIDYKFDKDLGNGDGKYSIGGDSSGGYDGGLPLW